MLQSFPRMKPAFPNAATRDEKPLVRAGTGTLISLVLAGLLAEVVNHEEASAGIDYGLSLLALLGATGCVVSLSVRISSNPGSLPRFGISHAPRPAAALPVVIVRGEDWPVLVALLFGALVGLISGLGGWV